ncbi:tryptophan synthase subunit alpha [Providencia vermicola]|nr:tryptophan synthase subunit alpha [Providencia sp. G1(2023)]MBC8653525.1 tryptophan synthase subunit alpha [Providencia vermicola]
MERYTQLFERLSHNNQGAFVPFVTLGDPDAELSLKIIDALISGGADALEIGIPFSDPLADGPTIQNANLRAFKSEITPTICFELLGRIREKHPTIPIGLLVYANLVFTNAALQGFGISEPEQVREAIKNGAAGAISGSAIVKIIENNLNKPDVLLKTLTEFVFKMKSATQK